MAGAAAVMMTVAIHRRMRIGIDAEKAPMIFRLDTRRMSTTVRGPHSLRLNGILSHKSQNPL